MTSSSNAAFQQYSPQGTDAAWKQQGSPSRVWEAGSQEDHLRGGEEHQ